MFRYWWLGANALQHYYYLMGLLKQPWHMIDLTEYLSLICLKFSADQTVVIMTSAKSATLRKLSPQQTPPARECYWNGNQLVGSYLCMVERTERAERAEGS